MILGNTCTRHCRFCSVGTGNPHGQVDETEPERVAEAVGDLGLKYVVLTSVDRDDLEDLGACAFARTVVEVKRQNVEGGTQDGGQRVRVEVLTPDFGGRDELIRQVVDAGPDVFGHNVETARRVSPVVRDRRASYRRSLEVLACVRRQAPDLLTKSGIMVGLGETDDEVMQTMRDLRSVGCDIVTIGQYLQPDRRCVPVERYVEPDRFREWQQQALDMGFRAAFCGPLVRSSYHAEEVFPT
jgi:lipoic acid synthetase